jgi:hypothetical protein
VPTPRSKPTEEKWEPGSRAEKTRFSQLSPHGNSNTLQPDKLGQWKQFLVDDAEQKLPRFAELVIEPSIVQ